MLLDSPHLPSPVPATREAVASLIPRLVGKEDPFAILHVDDGMHYAQALWVGDGFVLEYQDGSLDRHYRTLRDDLAADEVVVALCGYLERDPAWAVGLSFTRVELRSAASRAGYRTGRGIMRVLRFLGLGPFVRGLREGWAEGKRGPGNG